MESNGEITSRERRLPAHAGSALAAAVATASGAVVAEVVTVTTTQQYSASMTSSDTSASFDVLFTPVQNATDLVLISSGTVFTGEGATLDILAIASDDSTETIFSSFLTPFFRTDPLATITANTFTDFSAREIKGLRFTLQQFAPPPKPSLTLPNATRFQFVTVPEPAAVVLLACGLVAALFGRRLRRGRSTLPKA